MQHNNVIQNLYILFYKKRNTSLNGLSEISLHGTEQTDSAVLLYGEIGVAYLKSTPQTVSGGDAADRTLATPVTGQK